MFKQQRQPRIKRRKNSNDAADSALEERSGEKSDESFDPSFEPKRGAPQKSARNKVMDLLARRNYSELELQRKLAANYPDDEIQNAINFARESNWILPAAQMSESVATSLMRKKKGHRYINQYLKTKGLPPIKKDSTTEIQNGIHLVKMKLAKLLFKSEDSVTSEQFDKINQWQIEFKAKAQRLLANRGYDNETIRQVISKLMRKSE